MALEPTSFNPQPTPSWDDLPAGRPVAYASGSCEVAGQGCPVCAGALIPLGSFSRCARCGFSLCVGCEGGQPSG
jgi:hypothetical protein